MDRLTNEQEIDYAVLEVYIEDAQEDVRAAKYQLAKAEAWLAWLRTRQPGSAAANETRHRPA